MAFTVPDNYEPRATRFWVDESGQKWRSMGNICWYTNIDHDRRHEELVLYKRYHGNEDEYPRYANYDAIEVGKVADIPCDYFEEMGVPITYLDKHNPEQFEIIGASRWMGRPMSEIAPKGTYVSGGVRFYLPVESSQNVHVERERDSSSAVSTTEWSSSAAGYRRLYDRIVIKRKVQRCHGRSHHLFG